MTLYKYVPPERIDILERLRLRFTQPGAFNDVFEFLHGVKLRPRDWRAERLLDHTLHAESWGRERKKTLLELSQLSEPPDSVYDAQCRNADEHSNRWGRSLLVAAELVKILDGQLGILSLTKRNDSILMWSHYTNDHRGFAIGFDEQHPFFSLNKTQGRLPRGVQRVYYRKHRPQIRFDNLEDLTVLFRKSEEWAYEREWRMLMPLEAGTCLRSSVRQPAFSFDEVPLPVYLFAVPASAIVSVIAGARMPEAETEELWNTCTRKRSLRHVRVYKALPHPSDYKMDVLEP